MMADKSGLKRQSVSPHSIRRRIINLWKKLRVLPSAYPFSCFFAKLDSNHPPGTRHFPNLEKALPNAEIGAGFALRKQSHPVFLVLCTWVPQLDQSFSLNAEHFYQDKEVEMF
tara:strand:- start:2975 stop:3313 length:339 start_codon:yes stop_codon:yes gene_type:complete